MNRLATLLAVLSLFTAAALADDESALRVFLAREGVEGNQPLSGLSPTLENPLVDTTVGPQRLYLWAQVLGTEPRQKYISIGYNVTMTNTAEVVSAHTWNYVNMFNRWMGTNPGTLSGGELHNVRLAADPGAATFGVRNENHIGFDLQYDPATDATVIGWIEVDGVGELFLEVGDIGIIRTGGTWDDVYLGFGDEGDGLRGNSFDQRSTLADAIIIPEPAGWLLLAAVGMAIRRR